MPGRKYSDEQCNEAAVLREAGMSTAAIAKRLGMSSGAVYWHCLRLGADTPKASRPAAPKAGRMVVERSGHVVRRFSAEEDQKMLDMEGSGVRLSEIARTLGRKRNSVEGRLMTLARKEARSEEETA
tara:strand:+ start:6419 stop:6799 length:381 start_codon:yes stop_codon:yes gene_type:complete